MYSFYNVYSYLPLRYMDLDTVNSLKLFTLLEVNYYYTFTFLRLLFLDWFLFFFLLLLCKNTLATFEVILMTLHKKYHLSFLFWIYHWRCYKKPNTTWYTNNITKARKLNEATQIHLEEAILNILQFKTNQTTKRLKKIIIML